MAITDGVAQQDRAPYALRDGYFLPRERSLADHLSLAADLAAHVRAVGRGGGDAGDWTPMFEREPATWLARLIAFPLETRRAAFETALTEDPAAAAGLLRSLAREILRLRDALAGAGLPEIAGRIDAARSDPRLGSLLGGLAALGRRDADGAAALAARAAEDASAAEAGSARSAAVGDVFERARAARRGLALAHEQLLGMIEALRPAAERAFAARLGSGEIEPAVALAIAERELLAEADARINRFVARHRDFYHRTILGQSPRAAAPETILLRFLPAGGGALIEEGETVEGRGPGDPAPQRFRLLNGVAVTTAEVAEARILVFQRDPQISRQRILGYVTGVRATVRRVDDADARRRLFAPEAFDEATIGLEIESDMLRLAEGRRRVEAALTLRRRANVVPTLDTADAAARRESVAAALAADRALAEAFGAAPLSPIVARIAEAAARCDRAMHPRERLRLGCLACAETPAQAQAVFGGLVAETLVEDRPWPTGVVRRAVLDRLRAVFEDGRDGGAAAAEDAEELFAQTPREVFQQFLGGGFTVSLSTAEGFHGATTAKASPNDPADGPGFRVRLALDETAPPIAPHGGAAAPALRIHMAGQSLFCPFSLFEPYALKAVRLSVSVRGLRRLTARGEDGPIDVGQPFRPFGAIPKDGAAFTVGAPELAVKPVTRIEADILWGGLPRGAGGFAEHYRGYGEDFPTPRPQLAPAYLSPGGARPLGPPEPMIADAPGAARREARSPGMPSQLAVTRGVSPAW